MFEEMEFLVEALYGFDGAPEFWENESEKARRQGKLYTAKLYEESAKFSEQVQTAP